MQEVNEMKLHIDKSSMKNSSLVELVLADNIDSSFYDTDTSPIPQLDGLPNLPEAEAPYTRETCGQAFNSAEAFSEHDAFQYCYNDCEICFSTTVDSHFHQLEAHPESDFASTYIPQSTKQLFWASKGQ